MTPFEMRRALAISKPKDALAALALCFPGFEPTAQHIQNANNNGGMHDGQTINSIPDQVEAWFAASWAAFPQLIVSEAMVFEAVQVRAFDHGRLLGFAPATAFKKFTDTNAMLWLRTGPSLSPVDDLTLLYRECFGREADAEGYAFWHGELQAGHIFIPDLRAVFMATDEAKAR
ncbi:DUF4214 domain-containing protein [Sulfitobacter pacificus]|uniref:DUF4214 domain-containing protein n=1 Tax=Sulfitobacter pacificus TaxID=1499314 RepID=A0ABQ5VGE1_9RHOB|nr:DUF4214 domain-containing protein [Sulfitobacter pacificus]GLQ26142.1 hypothetical protein GCM10007927_09450 [Sulfitobacter pacificus]